MVFAILVLLGRYINYTLDLAGIAGLIIGIGTTADSFVVFFERIKDEIREGRSFRSAVPRGWVRARKTIVSGNAVTFLAAAVLYVLAIGQVKGFAFTLGLTTILDLVVVFLVTWPLVYLASKSVEDGQAGLQRPGRRSAGRARTPGRRRRTGAVALVEALRRDEDKTDGDQGRPEPKPRPDDSPRRRSSPTRELRQDRQPTCRTTASSSGSTPAPARSRSSGRRKMWYAISGAIVAVAIAVDHHLRGFTFGIDFKGGTTVSMPAAGQRPRSVAGAGRLQQDAGHRPGLGGDRRQRRRRRPCRSAPRR